MLSIANDNRTSGHLFAKRTYLPRITGMGVGFLCVSSVFYEDQHPLSNSNLITLVASLPALLCYPLVFGYINYRLSQQLNRKNQDLKKLSRVDGLSQENLDTIPTDENSKQYNQWVNRADQALYKAKGSGKNCTVRFDSLIT